MAQPAGRELTADANARAALKVREELARRRITRQKLAADAMISLSTLEKALSGKRPCTIATLIRREEALDMPLRDATGAHAPFANGHTQMRPAGLAPEDLGSYARPAVAWIEGSPVALLRSRIIESSNNLLISSHNADARSAY